MEKAQKARKLSFSLGNVDRSVATIFHCENENLHERNFPFCHVLNSIDQWTNIKVNKKTRNFLISIYFFTFIPFVSLASLIPPRRTSIQLCAFLCLIFSVSFFFSFFIFIVSCHSHCIVKDQRCASVGVFVPLFRLKWFWMRWAGALSGCCDDAHTDIKEKKLANEYRLLLPFRCPFHELHVIVAVESSFNIPWPTQRSNIAFSSRFSRQFSLFHSIFF